MQKNKLDHIFEFYHNFKLDKYLNDILHKKNLLLKNS